MVKLNVTPNSVKGVTFKMKYHPNSNYGFSDWQDNKKILECQKLQTTPNTMKRAYCYLGVGARINGQDPSGDASGKYLANCIIEYNVKYNIHFSERYNSDGNNEPIPHRTEL
jgi:hypothetical protein